MPPGSQIQIERRRLNEEIENAFIAAAQAASNIEMKRSFSKGAIYGDSQDFYQYFSYLIRLTAQLKEMEPPQGRDDPDLAKLKERVAEWKKRKLGSDARPEVVDSYLSEGLDIFDEYYKKLMHQGIIALPTKKG